MIRLSSLDSLYYSIEDKKVDLPQHTIGERTTLRSRACFYDLPTEALTEVKDSELHSYLILGFKTSVWKVFKPYLDEFNNFGIEYTYLSQGQKSYFGYAYTICEEFPEDAGIIFFSISTDKFTKTAGIQALYLLYVLIRSFSIRKSYYGLYQYSSLESMFNKINSINNEESLSEDGSLSPEFVLGINDFELMNRVFKYGFERQTDAFELMWRM